AAFVLAATATFNLQAVQRTDNIYTARCLADSAVDEAIARLQDDLGWSGQVDLQGLTAGSWGFLGFSASNSRNEAFSVNNSKGGNNQGWNRAVPDGDIH